MQVRLLSSAFTYWSHLWHNSTCLLTGNYAQQWPQTRRTSGPQLVETCGDGREKEFSQQLPSLLHPPPAPAPLTRVASHTRILLFMVFQLPKESLYKLSALLTITVCAAVLYIVIFSLWKYLAYYISRLYISSVQVHLSYHWEITDKSKDLTLKIVFGHIKWVGAA